MDYEVLSITASKPGGKAQKQKPAFVLLYFICLGLAAFVFAISCFVLLVSGLVLDLLAFVSLLGVALGSLVWSRVKRVEGPSVTRRLAKYFKNPVWK